jgi:hypothetical protein
MSERISPDPEVIAKQLHELLDFQEPTPEFDDVNYRVITALFNAITNFIEDMKPLQCSEAVLLQKIAMMYLLRFDQNRPGMFGEGAPVEMRFERDDNE